MKKQIMFFVSIVIILSVLAGCNAKKEGKEAKMYLNKVATYTADVNNYTKRTTSTLSSDKSLDVKSNSILTETQSMRKKIKTFSAIEPPRTLRHVHRKIVAQNYLLDDSLYILEGSIKAGKITSTALSTGVKKVKTNETTHEIKKFINLFKSGQTKKN